MTKRFFIRKSPSDLIQEQNKLIEKFIAKPSEEKVIVKEIPIRFKEEQMNDDSELYVEETEDFDFDVEDDLPFIPYQKSGNANLPSLNVETKDLDEDSVEKLRQTMNKKEV